MSIAYSNRGNGNRHNPALANVRRIDGARFFEGGNLAGSADSAALQVRLLPMEVQVWVPEQPFQF